MFGYSFKELLFQLGVSVLGTTVTGALASIYTEKPAVIFIWCLCAFALGLFISNQILVRKKLKGDGAEAIPDKRDNTSPLKINFPDEWSCSEFINEPARIGSDMVSRKVIWVNIYNDSSSTIRNVRAEMVSIKIWAPHGQEETSPLIAEKTFPLTFQECKQVLDLSPHMSARLPLISYARQFMTSFIRIEGKKFELLHEEKTWKFTVKVTADEFMPAQRDFVASVDGGGLQMSVCD